MTRISKPPYFDRTLPLIGLYQGLLLWALIFGPDALGVRVTMPLLMFVLLQLVATAPLLWYASAQADVPLRRRAWGVAVISLVVTLLPLGVDGLGDLFTSFEVDSHDDGLRALHLQWHGSWLPSVLAFVSLHLLLGWRTDGWGWDYERLFRLTWRDVVLTVVALALTGAFFGVLFAGAGLLRLIGVTLPWTLLQEPAFDLLIGCMALGAAYALGLARAKMLVVMRHFWLSLNAWFLPLVLAFVLVWVAALPFTGLQALFDTRYAAALLLGIVAMCINFANSVFQDGRAPAVFGARVGRFARWAWPALLVVVAVAGWALWLRVAHRGWSADRIWAALAWFIASLYVVGYSVSAWRSGPAWLPTIARTNIMAACVTVVSLLALLSPALSPERLAIHSQLARLHSGRVAPEDFDFQMLANDTVHGGREALATLAAGSGTPRDEAIARLAREPLASSVSSAADDNDSVPTEDQLRSRLTVLPATAAPDADLMQQLRGATQDAAWQLSQCRSQRYRCAVWLTDLNGDGRDDAVVISQHREMDHATAHLMTSNEGRWASVGLLLAPPAPASADAGATTAASEDGRDPAATAAARAADAARPSRTLELTLDQWIVAIGSRHARPIAPQWRDIEVNGQRWRTQVDTP